MSKWNERFEMNAPLDRFIAEMKRARTAVEAFVEQIAEEHYQADEDQLLHGDGDGNAQVSPDSR